MSDRHVQFGCGWCAPDGWLNFDASPTLRLERVPLLGRFIRKNERPFPINVRYGNIVIGLPVEANYYVGVYCSHVLEHLALEEFRIALRNTYLIMQRDGIFRLVVPDLSFFIKQYTSGNSPDAARHFMEGTGLGQIKRDWRLSGFLVQWLGGSQHRWMWDYPSMEQELVRAGFRNIRRATYGDAADPAFLQVEDLARWENCLGVECVK